MKNSRPFGSRHAACLCIAGSQDCLGRFIVKNQIANRVHNENWHCQILGQMPCQNDFNFLLRHLFSWWESPERNYTGEGCKLSGFSERIGGRVLSLVCVAPTNKDSICQNPEIQSDDK